MFCCVAWCGVVLWGANCKEHAFSTSNKSTLLGIWCNVILKYYLTVSNINKYILHLATQLMGYVSSHGKLFYDSKMWANLNDIFHYSSVICNEITNQILLSVLLLIRLIVPPWNNEQLLVTLISVSVKILKIFLASVGASAF